MEKRSNYTIDIARFVMAILVIGIHTEPFTNNIWLDRGYGILTRQCVPFFFVASGYFFIKNKASIYKTFFRLMLLYVVWSAIYLPFDVSELRGGGSFNNKAIPIRMEC